MKESIPKIYEHIAMHLQDMLQRHSKVLQVRADVHYPMDGTIKPEPRHLYRFNKNLKRNLERNRPVRVPHPSPQDSMTAKAPRPGAHAVDPRLIIVPEQHGMSDRPHFHILILVNGNAKLSSWDIQKRVESEWLTAIGASGYQGLVHACDQSGRCSYLLDRNSPALAHTLEDATRQSDYLSKSRGKEKRPKGAWRVLGSRIPTGKRV